MGLRTYFHLRSFEPPNLPGLGSQAMFGRALLSEYNFRVQEFTLCSAFSLSALMIMPDIIFLINGKRVFALINTDNNYNIMKQ